MRSCPLSWTCRRPWSPARPSSTRSTRATSWPTPRSAAATTNPPAKSRALIKVEGWYDTPTVQHCHIENHICAAHMEGGADHRGLLHPDPPHRPPGLRPGPGHPLGQGANRQTLHRRRLRQQAGRPLRAPVRLAHHPAGGPAGEDRLPA